MTASPRAVLGEPLDELERLARRFRYSGSWIDASFFASHGLNAETAAFIAACTPQRIAQLVALARAGMEDGEALRWIEDNAGHELRIDRDGDDVRVVRWRQKYVTYYEWFGRDIRAALRAARAPAGPGGENA